MRVLVIAAVVTASLPGVAQATVELPVEFGEMVRDSQLVVHGRVVDVRSQQTSDRRSIETMVTHRGDRRRSRGGRAATSPSGCRAAKWGGIAG